MSSTTDEEKADHQGLILSVTALVILIGAVWVTFHSQIKTYLATQLQGGECYNLNTWATSAINLIMHVSIFAAFVCVFFFTIVHSVEKLTIYRNLKGAITSILDDMEAVTGKPLNLSFEIPVSQELEDGDADAKRKIQHLTKKAITVFGALMGIGILVSMGIYFAMRLYAKTYYLDQPCQLTGNKLTALQAGEHFPDLRAIGHHNLVILGFVFVTEMFFLFGITLHYRSLDPNSIKHAFIQKLMALAGVTMEDSVQQSQEALVDLVQRQKATAESTLKDKVASLVSS